MKPIALHQCRHNQLRFDESELITDALSWPCAERQVGEFRPVHTAFRQEALGIERIWILPVCGKPMQDVGDDEREPSARQMEPAELVVGERLSREAPRRRIEAHRFVDHHARIRQIHQIGVSGGRPSSTVSISCSSRRCDAACCDSRYQVHVSASDVVS